MKDSLKKLLANLSNSFKGDNYDGYSSRKLTAFIIVAIAVVIHIKWLTLGDLSQMETVLTIDYTFISALFGMTTYQSLKSTKLGNNLKEPEATETKQEETK